MEEYESVMIQGNQCLEVSFFQSYSFACVSRISTTEQMGILEWEVCWDL